MPHMREPLDRVADHTVKELHWLWSPGGGKTTGIEGSIQWKMANRPSNTLLVGQKDDTAERWMETRFLPSMKKNPALRELVPPQSGTDRHRIRKTTVIFNHGFYLEAGGSAESNLQEKSMPYVILEEAWKLSEHPGRIQQAKQRTHDKWDALIHYIGQAGETHVDPDNDDTLADLYREWLKTDQRTFCWECPCCGTRQPFKWDQLKWDKVEIEGYGVDWTKTSRTVRMQCAGPDCEAEFHDTTSNRRMLAESGKYVVQNKNAEAGYAGYHANALCYWRIPWLKLVQQWDEAMEAKAKGDLSLLQVFTQQRLAEFWTPGKFEIQHELVTGGYNVSDYESGQLVDNERARAIGVDVQQNSLWFTVAAISGEGEIKVLNCGELLTFDELLKIQHKYQVKPSCVLIDSRYRRDYVFGQCADHGWTAYRGVPQESFSVNIAGTMTRAPFSALVPVQSGGGKKAFAINFCVNPIKDVIADIRAGRVGELQVPNDIDPRFEQHLNAEVKRRMTVGRENREQDIWVRIGHRDNHMLDNLMAIVGFSMVKRLIRIKEDN